MRQWTTPWEELTVEGVDLTQNQKIKVTYSQGSKVITFLHDDLDMSLDEEGNTVILVHFSQTQSGSLSPNSYCEVEVNWIDSNGERGATEIAKIPIDRNLLKEVMTWSD